MVKPSVYVETTIISYLTARPSSNVIVLAHQEITRRWWRRREIFELVASPLVIEEAQRGDHIARARRQRLLRNLSLLAVTDEARRVSRMLLQQKTLPERAEADALHMAVAVVHGVEYLLTWNCRHIANARRRPQIEDIIRDEGYEPPIFCTPEELLEE